MDFFGTRDLIGLLSVLFTSVLNTQVTGRGALNKLLYIEEMFKMVKKMFTMLSEEVFSVSLRKRQRLRSREKGVRYSIKSPPSAKAPSGNSSTETCPKMRQIIWPGIGERIMQLFFFKSLG